MDWWQVMQHLYILIKMFNQEINLHLSSTTRVYVDENNKDQMANEEDPSQFRICVEANLFVLMFLV